MGNEGSRHDNKSIRYVLGQHEDTSALAADCVGFACASGGLIFIGIEDGQSLPPPNQRVEDDLPEKLQKRIGQQTVNVGVTPVKRTAPNGGEYIELQIHRNQQSIPSTSDGRYFIRVADETQPVRGDDLTRLFNDRGSFVWELQTIRRLAADQYDVGKLTAFAEAVRASNRVSDFVKQKSDEELLDYYLMVRDGYLTQLGVLWVGRRADRAALLYPPVIQCIKYDERGRKIRKLVWDEYDLNPMELIISVWESVPDWRESYELPAGLFRQSVPHYEEVVVREILANALVHRPYTQQGDIFVNLHPDRLEVHNPGLLPIGVTPQNILHATVQRNRQLAKVFYDLALMEGEGSGFDRMYEVQLASGRPTPTVTEGPDRVVVTVYKQILKPELVDFMAKVEQTFQPTQRELITLGMITQGESITAIDLEHRLALRNSAELKNWLGQLRDWDLVKCRGKTRGVEYFINPEILRKLEFTGTTTLKGIEKHRLRELLLRDLELYRDSTIGKIHDRIGLEIPRRKIQRALRELASEGLILAKGVKRSRRYHFVPQTIKSAKNGAKFGINGGRQTS